MWLAPPYGPKKLESRHDTRLPNRNYVRTTIEHVGVLGEHTRCKRNSSRSPQVKSKDYDLRAPPIFERLIFSIYSSMTSKIVTHKSIIIHTYIYDTLFVVLVFSLAELLTPHWRKAPLERGVCRGGKIRIQREEIRKGSLKRGEEIGRGGEGRGKETGRRRWVSGVGREKGDIGVEFTRS